MGCLAGFICAVGPQAQSPFYPVADVPPRLSLIQVSTPDANNRATISGAAGSVPGGSTVLLLVLETGYYATAQAATDGSFSQTLFAPAGTSLLIKADPLGLRLRTLLETGQFGTQLLVPLPGTIARVPERQLAAPGIAFAGAGLTGFANGPMIPLTWTFEGIITTSALQPGGTLRITGTLEIRSAALSGAGQMRVNAGVFLERLAGSDGFGTAARNVFSSAILTPTGLPIERTPSQDLNRPPDRQAILTRIGTDVARTALNIPFMLPADLPAGYYRPYLGFVFEGAPLEPPPQPLFQTSSTGRRPWLASLHLPVIRVGQAATPRLFWTLFSDTLSNGSRGVRAIEDRNRFAQSPRLLTQAETIVIPRINPETRQPAIYRLDPFVLTQSVGDRGVPPNPPLIPLRFPSGSLTARIERPDGSTTVIGPAPFAQPRLRAPVRRSTFPMDTGGGDITDAYELSTMDPRFEISFEKDGRYLIMLDGWVEDIWGNRWNGGGTYEIFVASPLSLDTTVLPGTPFEVGDTLAPGVVITPAVAAEVETRIRFAPNSDPARLIDRTIRGRANRFGYFSPAGQGVRFDQPGEYRVDITASFIDAEGNWRMGSRTWGGMIASRTPSIIAHGQRGIDDQPASRAQWFFRSQTGVSIETGGHVHFPFQSGDVIWAQKSDAVVPHLTFQDPTGQIVNILRNLGPLRENQVAAGEIALSCYSPKRDDPLLNPFNCDVWGYAYRSVQRPLVRIREVLGEVGLPVTYWRFSTSYAGQIGASGDLPNDFKFQYGGAVLRGTSLGTPQYAIYGSLFVLVPNNDPLGGTRVFPPFQGNGGGPSGGPIMKLKGQDIDLFIHLTSVRPGTVLEVGDNFSIAGAVGPPLPAMVSTKVTTPTGRTFQFSGRANRVGYYYHPEHDFAVQEPGIYTVDVRVTFDGRTSAGQVTEPFPTGDVLGSANGRFFVYVVPRESPLLTVNVPERAMIAAPGNLDITASAPPELTLRSNHVTTMMPGFLLQTGELSVLANSIFYRYDPATLARDFPNLDLNPPADVITISLFGQTINAQGQTSYAARVLVLHGQELLNPTVTSREKTALSRR
jgi:hypothetical protein